MANKTQIKNFLQNQKQLTLSKLSKEEQDELDKISLMFKAKYEKEFNQIEQNLFSSLDILTKISCEMKDENIGTYNEQYSGSPSTNIRNAITRFDLDNIGFYFYLNECEKVQDQYEKKTRESRDEYDKILAITKEMNAKESYDLLQNLGFDLSSLEVKKECTAVSTYIDATKLYIPKEDKQCVNV